MSAREATIDLIRQTRIYMDTPVTIDVVAGDEPDACAAVERAFDRFRLVEACCSRFDPDSELRRLAARAGGAVAVSPLLFEAVRFACRVARASGGAFDPTVGRAQEARGFDRDYRSGRAAPSGLGRDAERPDWRDVQLDARRRTVTLRRPLLLDLGAVAKGLAIDLAARELSAFPGCAVDAGGDVRVRGRNADGEPWRVGIRHPRRPGAICTLVRIEDGAVCTSGDYERPCPQGGGHHLLDPREGRSPADVASCTVVAPDAMLADALSTAACVLGPRRGIRWLERQGVDGLILTPDLQRYETSGFAGVEPCLR